MESVCCDMVRGAASRTIVTQTSGRSQGSDSRPPSGLLSSQWPEKQPRVIHDTDCQPQYVKMGRQVSACIPFFKQTRNAQWWCETDTAKGRLACGVHGVNDALCTRPRAGGGLRGLRWIESQQNRALRRKPLCVRHGKSADACTGMKQKKEHTAVLRGSGVSCRAPCRRRGCRRGASSGEWHRAASSW